MVFLVRLGPGGKIADPKPPFPRIDPDDFVAEADINMMCFPELLRSPGDERIGVLDYITDVIWFVSGRV